MYSKLLLMFVTCFFYVCLLLEIRVLAGKSKSKPVKAKSKGGTPPGLCFVPTKKFNFDLSSTPLISKESENYASINRYFIRPFIESVSAKASRSTPNVLPKVGDYIKVFKTVPERKTAIAEYNAMLEGIEVFYEYNDIDPEDMIVEHGIWDIAFGFLIFKFNAKLARMQTPDFLVFNGLLPALGIAATDLSAFKKNPKNMAASSAHAHAHAQAQTRSGSGSGSDSNTTAGAGATEVVQKYVFTEEKSIVIQTIPMAPYGLFYVVFNDPNTQIMQAVMIADDGNHIVTELLQYQNNMCAADAIPVELMKGQCATDIVVSETRDLIKIDGVEFGCDNIVLCKEGIFRFDYNSKPSGGKNMLRAYSSVITETDAGGTYTALHSSESSRAVADKPQISFVFSEHIPDMCPMPSIAVKWDCSARSFPKDDKDVFMAERPWNLCRFCSSDADNENARWEYRMVPPLTGPTDPWRCKKTPVSDNPEQNARIRLQINKNKDKFWNCCMTRNPEHGTGNAIEFFWEDDPVLGSGFKAVDAAAAEGAGAGAAAEGGSTGANDKAKNKLEWKTLEGKKPDEMPEHAKDALLAYRRSFTPEMSEKELRALPITKKEFDGMVKQMEGPTEGEMNSANEHAENQSIAPPALNFQQIQSVFFSVVFCLFALIFSCYWVPLRSS